MKRIANCTRQVRLWKARCATLRKYTQFVRLELQISCSNQLSYAGAAHVKAGLASSSRDLAHEELAALSLSGHAAAKTHATVSGRCSPLHLSVATAF